jgi:hypothetical protein
MALANVIYQPDGQLVQSFFNSTATLEDNFGLDCF